MKTNKLGRSAESKSLLSKNREILKLNSNRVQLSSSCLKARVSEPDVMKKQIKIIIAIVLLALYLNIISLASALVIDSVSMNPNEIAPRETSVVLIGIENDADVDVEDVSVSLDLTNVPFAPFDSSSEYGIDVIKEDKTKFAEFEIIALNNAESGIYKIPVIITFTENEVVKTKNSLISISVNSEPIIGVYLEDGLLLKGQENEINIKIINKGLSDAKFLEVEIGSSTYYSIRGQRSIYVGDIDSDDFDSVNFKVYFRENVPNNINLLVTASYKDFKNNKRVEDFDLKLNVYSKKKAIELGLLKKDNTKLYISIAIGLIIVYIIYRNIRKRRRMKKQTESLEEF